MTYAKKGIRKRGTMSYLKKYEYVTAVLKYGGISQAAEHLNISQPTFSKYLKKLEAELGLELFDRSTLPIKLTRAGECFVNAGKRFLDLDRQLQKQLNEIKTNSNSVVRVGISPSRSPYMIPKIIALFKEKNPTSRVVIEEKTTKELSNRLREGELDLVISLLDEETRDFEAVTLFDESILLAVSKEKSTEKDTARDILMSSPLINVGKGQAMWQIFNEILEELSVPEPEIECQSIESALSLVKKGIGAMIVPSYIAREKSDIIRFLPMVEGEISSYKRKVCLFFRKEQFLTQSEKDFIDCVIKIEKKEK